MYVMTVTDSCFGSQPILSLKEIIVVVRILCSTDL